MRTFSYRTASSLWFSVSWCFLTLQTGLCLQWGGDACTLLILRLTLPEPCVSHSSPKRLSLRWDLESQWSLSEPFLLTDLLLYSTKVFYADPIEQTMWREIATVSDSNSIQFWNGDKPESNIYMDYPHPCNQSLWGWKETADCRKLSTQHNLLSHLGEAGRDRGCSRFLYDLIFVPNFYILNKVSL